MTDNIAEAAAVLGSSSSRSSGGSYSSSGSRSRSSRTPPGAPDQSSAGTSGDPYFLYPSLEPPPAPSPADLAKHWLELSSLEAAALAGCWQGGPAAAEHAAAAATVGMASCQQAWQQQQQAMAFNQTGGHGCISSSSSSKTVLLPAFAADLAAVGRIAVQLYQQQSQQQQEVALGRAAGMMTAETNLHSHSSSAISSARGAAQQQQQQQRGFQPSLFGVPASVALFAQQCAAGQLSAAGLLHTSFFPAWMDDARNFLLKLLFTQQVQSEHAGLQLAAAVGSTAQQAPTGCSRSDSRTSSTCGSTGGTVSSTGGGTSSEDVKCWQMSDAFKSLVQLAAPDGELQQLAATPEALQLCLPAILHVIQGRLLSRQQQHGRLPTGSDMAGSYQHRHDQQQQQQAQTLLDFAGSVCVVVLRLASVLSPEQLQQHLLPLLQDLVTAEQDSTDEVGASAATAAAGGNAARQQQQQQQRGVSSMAVQVEAGRRAVLQPLLWQILVAKLPQQVLLSGLLPRLLTAALEPQQDTLIGTGTWRQQHLLGFYAFSSSSSSSGSTAVPASGYLSLLPPGHTAATVSGSLAHTAAAVRSAAFASAGSLQNGLTDAQQQQQQQCWSQTQLASSCFGVLAEALPLPVVCQYLLRPLLIALPYADSSSSSERTLDNTAVLDPKPDGAAQALLAIGRVLPQRLAAEFVFRPALQLALLPLQHRHLAAAGGVTSPTASPGSVGNLSTAPAALRTEDSEELRVGQYTLAALPVLEGLLAHVLLALNPENVLPDVDTDVLPLAAAAVAGGGGTATSAPAAGSSVVVTSGGVTGDGVSSTSSSKPAVGTTPPGNTMTGSTTSATSTATAPVGTAPAVPPSASTVNSSKKQGLGFQLHELSELLLLPPDPRAVQDCPLLYPRIAALLLLALEQAAAASSSSSTVNDGSGYAAIVGGWLLPQVLVPLLSPVAAAAWQQQGPQLVKCYWRVVLLLYAAAVRQLGLSKVRDGLPSWHSIEVRLCG